MLLSLLLCMFKVFHNTKVIFKCHHESNSIIKAILFGIFFNVCSFIYLFGCVGSQLQHSESSLLHAGFFVEACGLFVAVHGLSSSCGTRASECTGSVAAARGLGCHTACGILVPQPGIEPVSPALEGRFLTTGPLGKSQRQHYLLLFHKYLKKIEIFEKIKRGSCTNNAHSFLSGIFVFLTVYNDLTFKNNKFSHQNEI